MVDKVDRSELTRERVKDKPKDDTRARPKESDFGEVMKKNQLQPTTTYMQNVQSKFATEQAIKEAMKEEDRQGDRNKKDDKDKDENKSSNNTEDGRTQTLTDQRVFGKGSLKQNTGGGGGQGSFSGGQGSGSERKNLSKLLKSADVNSIPLDLKGSFAKKLSESMKNQEANQTQLSQQSLNKIIQSVKVGINMQGDKEIQLILSEKIFRGLKLKVTSRDGKVSVSFKSNDAKGREILEKNKEGLKKALADKGIEVDEIEIS